MSTTDPQTPRSWSITPIAGSPLPLLIGSWYLEKPATDEPWPNHGIIEIRGWALAAPEKQDFLHVVVQLCNKTLSFPMNVERPDVVDGVLGQDPEGHPQLKCGFRYAFPLPELAPGFVIGFETDLEIHPAVRVEAALPPQS
jgi:hypothetical protein